MGDARGHGVHADLVLGQLAGERQREPVYGELARGVGEAGGLAVLAHHGARVHDGAALALLDHDAGRRLGAHEHGGHVDGHDLVELLQGVIDQRGAGADAGVVAQHVQAPEAIDHRREGRRHGVGIGQCGRDAHDVVGEALLGELGERRIHGLLARAGQRHLRAVLQKLANDSEPDAARAAGDDGHLSFYDAHGRPFSRVNSHNHIAEELSRWFRDGYKARGSERRLGQRGARAGGAQVGSC